MGGEIIMKYQFEIGNRKIAFSKKGRKAAHLYEGVYFVNAEIKAADGTMFDGVIEIDTESSGEHCNTFILLPDKIVEQGTPNFLKSIGKKDYEFFPYKYRYKAVLPCHDHHIGPDGWSL